MAYDIFVWVFVYWIMFLPSKMMVSEATKKSDYKARAIATLLAIGAFTLIPAVLFSSWWVSVSYFIYAFTISIQILTEKYSREDAEIDMTASIREMILIFLLIAVTIFVRPPAFGLVVRMEGSGLWNDHPAIVIFIGFVIFTAPPMSKIFGLQWFTTKKKN